MGISPEDLASRYPLLFHMAEADSWPSIRRYGLLSTSAILDLLRVPEKDRHAIESAYRPEKVVVGDERHGFMVIRDQKPMSNDGLRRALQDSLTPRDWYRMLNQKVFFWLSENRLHKMLGARAYRDERHTVLIVDCRKLLDAHASRVYLSPINSGATKPFPHPRGRDTFLPLQEYPFEEWLKQRRGRDPVVELAVDYSVPDVKKYVIRVEEREASRSIKVIWSR